MRPGRCRRALYRWKRTYGRFHAYGPRRAGMKSKPPHGDSATALAFVRVAPVLEAVLENQVDREKERAERWLRIAGHPGDKVAAGNTQVSAKRIEATHDLGRSQERVRLYRPTCCVTPSPRHSYK